ncbi:hypothetical protein J2X48_000726 [Bosea sp. BE271]|uniref:hypothetical protein n=1 Tax=Bosea TaxID=85413 RepID=UPI00285E6736|nr:MULTISPECIES: hypothetical protein [Bosea]MDR6826470.1 hypothetical protein [Bosea robiniae]MDR6893180.1 hypothetical protein [Bosea sp. BE109]MDR7137121.1 hypothetical protein [Bosea sp. BE168]MDR7173820.1 hypothetical protein [Bosea sp. BE271]
MARIRSIHPGLFTDEAFMSASAHARLLIIGIWTEAWDDGVFEWKPLTLKAKLFPVDSVDMAVLLDELVSLDFIRSFEAGKRYGAVRNFQKYQRPKKPNSSGVLPSDLHEYVHVVPNQFPTISEKSPQMEDGGGREGEEEDDAASAASSASAPVLDLNEAERRCCEAAGSDRLGSFAPIVELLHRQADLEHDILPVVRSRPAPKNGIQSWRYYVPVISEAMAKRAPPVAASGPPKVFVAKDTPEWAERVAAGHKPGMVTQDPKTKAEGWYFTSKSTHNKGERAA